MKKLLFSLAMIAGMSTMNAQTVVFSDDFNDESISDWTLYDEDGDGNNWEPFDGDFWGLPSDQLQCMVSWSYLDDSGESLTPDNWIVSPAIDLTGASGEIILKWDVGSGATEEWLEDFYGVYVFPATTEGIPTSESEVYFGGPIPQMDFDNGVVGNTTTVDISEFAGQEVKIAFRHYDTFDMYSLLIDNVAVEAETMAVSDLNGVKSAVYPNPVVDVLNVNVSSKFNASNVTVSITDMTGKTVKTFGNASSYNVADLAAGVYVVKITDGKTTETKKIVKK